MVSSTTYSGSGLALAISDKGIVIIDNDKHRTKMYGQIKDSDTFTRFLGSVITGDPNSYTIANINNVIHNKGNIPVPSISNFDGNIDGLSIVGIDLYLHDNTVIEYASKVYNNNDAENKIYTIQYDYTIEPSLFATKNTIYFYAEDLLTNDKWFIKDSNGFTYEININPCVIDQLQFESGQYIIHGLFRSFYFANQNLVSKALEFNQVKLNINDLADVLLDVEDNFNQVTIIGTAPFVLLYYAHGDNNNSHIISRSYLYVGNPSLIRLPTNAPP